MSDTPAPTDTVCVPRELLRRCRSIIDNLMGDSDLPEDDSDEMHVMQEISSILAAAPAPVCEDARRSFVVDEAAVDCEPRCSRCGETIYDAQADCTMTTSRPSTGDVREKSIQQMTDQEIVSLMRGDSLLATIRQIFYFGCAEMENADQQHTPPSVIDKRKREFLIAQRLIKAVQDSTRPSAGDVREDAQNDAFRKWAKKFGYDLTDSPNNFEAARHAWSAGVAFAISTRPTGEAVRDAKLCYVAKGYVAADHRVFRIKRGDVVWLGFTREGGGWYEWYSIQNLAKPFDDKETCERAAKSCNGPLYLKPDKIEIVECIYMPAREARLDFDFANSPPAPADEISEEEVEAFGEALWNRPYAEADHECKAWSILRTRFWPYTKETFADRVRAALEAARTARRRK